jgi:hypothetical protein
MIGNVNFLAKRLPSSAAALPRLIVEAELLEVPDFSAMVRGIRGPSRVSSGRKRPLATVGFQPRAAIAPEREGTEREVRNGADFVVHFSSWAGWLRPPDG